MAKRDRTLERLDELGALKNETDHEVLLPKLREALDEKVNLIVAKAADLARKNDLSSLAPQMIAAFDRFMHNAEKTDQGCAAKASLAEALVKFNAECRDLYLTGIRHIQLEPVWGGSRDTAAKLRGLCALGLVALGYKDVLYELADLLFDDDVEARQLAARALGGTGVDSAALLLRAKLAAGNDSAEIYGECFASLLSLQPNRSIEYIARYLSNLDAALVEAAALSIGASRNTRAFELLRAAYESNHNPELTTPLLLAIATTRQREAIDFLIEEIEDGQGGPDAVSALRVLKSDAELAKRVEAKLTELNDATRSRRWRSG